MLSSQALMSSATKAKLRAAWKRRKAALKTVKKNVGAAKAGSKAGVQAFIKGKPKKAEGGGEAHG